MSAPRGAASTAAARTTPHGMGGRWSALPVVDTDPTRRALAATDVLLDRYGVLTRGSVVGEHLDGGFSTVYPVLKAAEESGRARRGYFVEGLGAAQFALPGAVDRLREQARTDVAPAADPAAAGLDGPDDDWGPPGRPARGTPSREAGPAALVLAATDPANCFGAALPWPEAPRGEDGSRGHQPARKAGALVVLVDGTCVLYVEKGGRTLLSFTDDAAVLQPAADALALAVREGALGRLQVERADGAPVAASSLGGALEAAGFRPTPRGLRLRG